ncbi:hypothetical protein [Leuconostoc lactis]|uniref:hypothetical protein n=1 Tax=Leuconostoc lactis TaxID=1246 RepID=UPI0012E28326|nr:hypothetical protein [Leuconostoc lactis]
MNEEIVELKKEIASLKSELTSLKTDIGHMKDDGFAYTNSKITELKQQLITRT